MLRDLNEDAASARRDSTNEFIGVLASEIPTGFPLESFLLNDIDAAYPNRLYSLEILTLPSSGVLYLDKAGTGSFEGAPDGTYTETQRVRKFDDGVGLVSTADGTYSLTVGVAATPTVTGVSVSPATATGSQTFTASVSGTNSPSQAVTWTTSAGTITSGGVFTAPAQTSSVQTITITATSVADSTKAGAATVTIAAIAPTVTAVTVSPATATGSQAFSAVVSGTNGPSQAVTWAASSGAIDGSGVFIAPVATSSEQSVTITARSVQDASQTGTATVTIAAIQVIQVAQSCTVNFDGGTNRVNF